QFVTDPDELHQTLKSEISEAQKRYQENTDRHRKPAPDFQVGQKAFVKAQFFRSTRPSKKLSDKYLGSFEIIGQAGSHSFVLRLPDNFRQVHPVYHVSMLEPAHPNPFPTRSNKPPPPIEIEGEQEYELAEIVDSKIDNRRRCKLLYKVKWLGYKNTEDEFSWMPATELNHASDLISNFHSAYPTKPGPLSAL